MRIKLKTVEYNTHPRYSDGCVMIKEDTEIERPIAIVPFPLGKHINGTIKQKQYAELLSATPELIDIVERFIEVSGSFNDKQFGKKYPDAVSVYYDAKNLIDKIRFEMWTKNQDQDGMDKITLREIYDAMDDCDK